MKYRELVEKSNVIKSFIENDLNLSTSGRFDYYLKIVSELAEAFESKTVDKWAQKYNVPDIGYSLKELVQLVTIFEFAQNQLKTIRKEETDIFISRLKIILEGTAMIDEETPNNSRARNYEFELRIATKFYNAGYTNISYNSGHDLVIKIRGRKYAVECKRIIAKNDDVIIKRTNKAIDQLEGCKNYYGGFVALDITQKFEKGVNWVVTSDKKYINVFVSKQIGDALQEIYNRDSKIKTAAKNENDIILIGNLSGAYMVESTRDLGWIQHSMFMVL